MSGSANPNPTLGSTLSSGKSTEIANHTAESTLEMTDLDSKSDSWGAFLQVATLRRPQFDTPIKVEKCASTQPPPEPTPNTNLNAINEPSVRLTENPELENAKAAADNAKATDSKQLFDGLEKELTRTQNQSICRQVKTAIAERNSSELKVGKASMPADCEDMEKFEVPLLYRAKKLAKSAPDLEYKTQVETDLRDPLNSDNGCVLQYELIIDAQQAEIAKKESLIEEKDERIHHLTKENEQHKEYRTNLDQNGDIVVRDFMQAVSFLLAAVFNIGNDVGHTDKVGGYTGPVISKVKTLHESYGDEFLRSITPDVTEDILEPKKSLGGNMLHLLKDRKLGPSAAANLKSDCFPMSLKTASHMNTAGQIDPAPLQSSVLPSQLVNPDFLHQCTSIEDFRNLQREERKRKGDEKREESRKRKDMSSPSSHNALESMMSGVGRHCIRRKKANYLGWLRVPVRKPTVPIATTCRSSEVLWIDLDETRPVKSEQVESDLSLATKQEIINGLEGDGSKEVSLVNLNVKLKASGIFCDSNEQRTQSTQISRRQCCWNVATSERQLAIFEIALRQPKHKHDQTFRSVCAK